VQDLYRISRQLAAVVVPHEYGLDEPGKLLIGSKICSELLGKLLIDLESMKVCEEKAGGLCAAN
jgi:inositol hexakisphosphate/diphosphoinositol-pentakisphosphate kinase